MRSEALRHTVIGLIAVCVVPFLACGCRDLQAGSSTTLPSANTKSGGASPSTDYVALGQDGWLMGVPLPTVVSSVVEVLGEPATVQLPTDIADTSPWGQWFRWDIGQGDYTYSVLGDDYDRQTPTYSAEVRVAVLRRDSDVVSPVVVDGVSLGSTTRADLEALYGDAVQASGLASRTEFDETGTYADCLMREQGGIYTFYLFDKTGLLVGICQATMDVGGAD